MECNLINAWTALGNGVLFCASPQAQVESCVIMAHGVSLAGHSFHVPAGIRLQLPDGAGGASGLCPDLILSGGIGNARAALPSYASLLQLFRALNLCAQDELPHLVLLRPVDSEYGREYVWLSELLRRLRTQALQIHRISALLCDDLPASKALAHYAGRQAYQAA
ncbi:hypothetical protein V8J88_01430 [Massilia sp. W12]|uniref:hypothetical protein n=1 Tax=Massilia sp. W12 TaxID=3126507 RepID=UPI0030D22F14